MKTHNRLGIYVDVKEVADLALKHGGGSYDCADTGTAQNFAHRFYKFRKLWREIYGADDCVYDRLILPRVKSSTVEFKLRQHVGTFRPAQQSTAVDSDDDLLNFVSKMIKEQQDD